MNNILYEITVRFDERSNTERFLTKYEKSTHFSIGTSLIEFIEADLTKKEKDSIFSESLLTRLFTENQTLYDNDVDNHINYLKSIQNIYRNALYCILDEENTDLKDLTSYQRLIYWQTKNKSPFYNPNFTLGDPDFIFRLKIEVESNLPESIYTQLIDEKSLIEYIRNSNPDPKEYYMYALLTIKEACNVLLFQMIKSNIVVKKCNCCEKYFIPNSQKEKYCTRLYEDDKTCRDVGYLMKVKEDIFLNLYATAYRTKNSQKQRKTKPKYESERLKKKYEKLKEKYDDAISLWREENRPKIREYQEKYNTITNEQEKQALVEEFKEMLSKPLEV